MDSETLYINSVLIPRRALAKRMAFLWLFEIIACLCGFGPLVIVSAFCIFECILLTLKFRTVWRLYYHPTTLYIVLGLLVIPSAFIGLALRTLIRWLILNLPVLIF